MEARGACMIRCIEALSGGHGPSLGDLDCRWNGSIHTKSGGTGPGGRIDADRTPRTQDQNAPRPQEAGQETGFLAKAGTTDPATTLSHRVRLSSLREIPAMCGGNDQESTMTSTEVSRHDILDIPPSIRFRQRPNGLLASLLDKPLADTTSSRPRCGSPASDWTCGTCRRRTERHQQERGRFDRGRRPPDPARGARRPDNPGDPGRTLRSVAVCGAGSAGGHGTAKST